MITVKYLNGDSKISEKKFDNVKEALLFDYYLWNCTGENCSFYYKGVQIGTDNHKSIDENITILESQMRYIDSIICN